MVSIEEFIEKVKETLEITEGNITADSDIRSFPNWSSMNALIIMAMFETEFDATITGDDLRSCTTVGDLHRLLSRKQV